MTPLCSMHPRYRALRRPRVKDECSCWTVWRHKLISQASMTPHRGYCSIVQDQRCIAPAGLRIGAGVVECKPATVFSCTACGEDVCKHCAMLKEPKPGIVRYGYICIDCYGQEREAKASA